MKKTTKLALGMMLLFCVACVPEGYKQNYQPVASSNKLNLKYYLEFDSSYAAYNDWPEWIEKYSEDAAQKIIDAFIGFKVENRQDADIILKVNYEIRYVGDLKFSNNVQLIAYDQHGNLLYRGSHITNYQQPRISVEWQGESYVFSALEPALSYTIRMLTRDSRIQAFANGKSEFASVNPQILTERLAVSSVHATDNIKEFALVIGNSSYPTSPLRNPIHDAQDISNSLHRLGFTVIQKNNATLREMDAAMNQFYASLKQGGVGLFYYAGHGIQVDGRNYLVPVDATIDSESDAKFKCMDAVRILGKMEDAGNAMNIVILDACRNNPFARSFRSASRGLARMDAPTGSIVAYSTAPGSVAADGDGRNGVYTKHFLKHMMTPGLDIGSVFLQTRKDVIRETGGKQVPWESSSLTDYFFFVNKGAAEQ